jgi:arylsulfatase A-like enzyme
MTGRHPDRYGIYYANSGHIPASEITLAEMVKEQGYTTGHFGKWHLGSLTRDTIDANRGGRPENDQHYSPPWENGFDVCFSTESKVPTWDPMVVPPASAGDVSPKLESGKAFGTYYWDGPGLIETSNLDGDDSRVIMDRVLPFIERAIDSEKPFLAVIWFHSPHLPVLTGEKYKNLYAGLSEDQQQYYGTLTAMDEQIGRLRAYLRELDIEEDTALFFTSDNGPEGPEVKGRTQGITKGLNGRKRSLKEGGIRVPGLIEWPGTIQPGVVDQFPAFTSDYFPTIASMIGININAYQKSYDGVDLMPILTRARAPRGRETPLVFKLRDQVALIDNQYKIYSKDDGEHFQLFDLNNDPQERVDLTETLPELSTELIQSWENWKKESE